MDLISRVLAYCVRGPGLSPQCWKKKAINMKTDSYFYFYKGGQWFKHMLHQSRHTDGDWTMKRFPVSLLTGEAYIETTAPSSTHLLKQLNRTNHNNFWLGCGVSGTLIWCLAQCYRYFGIVYQFLTSLDICLSTHPAVSPPSPREDWCLYANVDKGPSYHCQNLGTTQASSSRWTG